MNSVENLNLIKRNIEKAKAGYSVNQQVNLIAVSKTHSIDAIKSLLDSGHRIFGENKVQEAKEKFPLLKEKYPNIELHLIGSLQSNKVKDALSLFDVIHTIDRTSLIDEIIKELVKNPRSVKYFIQVNIGNEPQKGGVATENLGDLINYAKGKIVISGLMCVPPFDKNPEPYFLQLKQLADKYNLAELSMGMSGDYEAAIKCGATYIRVGTAIFGQRIL